jgi:primary-amine oxidase
MHHVPHTGDLPVTIFQTAQSSLVISPHNYHLGSPSKRVTQAVKIFKDKTTNKTVVNYNKADRHSCTFEMGNSQLDLANYMAPALDSLIIL